METAVVAMSGGVDSSVAAFLMQEAGYRVIGVTFDICRQETVDAEAPRYKLPPASDTIADAATVAEYLGIDHRVIAVSELFENHVIKPAIETYMSAATPNPCLLCNKHIKFGHVLNQARSWGATTIVTGHYARIVMDHTQTPRLLRAVDQNKDQSYVLFSLLDADLLDQVLFPLGDMTKTEVRDIADKRGIPTSKRPESQDLCFPLRDYIPDTPGTIVDQNGKLLGHHDGINRFTIGQRQGLGIASTGRLYVLEIRPATREIVLGPDHALFSNRVRISPLYWSRVRPRIETAVKAKIRYNHDPAPAVVTPDDRGAMLVFDAPQRAITPGQGAVCYIGEEVIAGGWIAS